MRKMSWISSVIFFFLSWFAGPLYASYVKGQVSTQAWLRERFSSLRLTSEMFKNIDLFLELRRKDKIKSQDFEGPEGQRFALELMEFALYGSYNRSFIDILESSGSKKAEGVGTTSNVYIYEDYAMKKYRGTSENFKKSFFKEIFTLQNFHTMNHAYKLFAYDFERHIAVFTRAKEKSILERYKLLPADEKQSHARNYSLKFIKWIQRYHKDNHLNFGRFSEPIEPAQRSFTSLANHYRDLDSAFNWIKYTFEHGLFATRWKYNIQRNYERMIVKPISLPVIWGTLDPDIENYYPDSDYMLDFNGNMRSIEPFGLATSLYQVWSKMGTWVVGKWIWAGYYIPEGDYTPLKELLKELIQAYFAERGSPPTHEEIEWIRLGLAYKISPGSSANGWFQDQLMKKMDRLLQPTPELAPREALERIIDDWVTTDPVPPLAERTSANGW